MAIGEGLDWVPSACTLPSAARPLRVAEFDKFFTVVRRSIRQGPTRLDLVVPCGAEVTGRGLAERESQCCSFFTFDFEHAGAHVVMHISITPDHVEVLDALEARVVAAAGRNRS